MIKSRRIEKVSSLLKKEISLIINYDLEDDLVSGNFVSVTNIELTSDLQICKIFISTSAGDELKNLIIEQLNSKKNIIRHYLSQRLSMKRIPDLIFKKDKVFDEGIAVLKVLDELRLNNNTQKESIEDEKDGKN
tara:strand:- start:10 stop:411 length:402 start_codon:yes stop_codon:yes gene_type:complete